VWIDARRLVYSVALDLQRRREHYLVDLKCPRGHGQSAGERCSAGAPPHVEEDVVGLIRVERSYRLTGGCADGVPSYRWDHLFILTGPARCDN
jgi:hypothetical protein